jgi:hypothetical protein
MRLKDQLRKGDRLWLFTSGMLCGNPDEPAVHQVYLVQLLCVERCDKNPDFDPSEPPHPSENVRYRIWVQDRGCLAIHPPLLVEDIIFPDGRDFPPARGQTVGERLQTPRKLVGRTLQALKARLKAKGCGQLPPA